MSRILVTGASGFIGTRLHARLLIEGFDVTAAFRHPPPPSIDRRIRPVVVGNIDKRTDWTQALSDAEVIIHLAARVHVMQEHAADPLKAYREVNVDGTARLAKCAAEAGARRFIYLSSVKVHGEENEFAYTELHPPCPEDGYGISKREAELELAGIAAHGAMEHVVIRPPLVYGPGVKANFLALLKLIDYDMPLPLASITNRRSFIYLENLVDCLVNCVAHPAAAGRTYLVSDGQDLSTPELVRLIADSLNRRARLFPFPQSLLQLTGCLLGRRQTVNRLLRSLTVDISRIKREIGWTPPFSPKTGLLNTAQWFKESGAKQHSC
jgi:nucleoside-diphosphate-sugar epimerase